MFVIRIWALICLITFSATIFGGEVINREIVVPVGIFEERLDSALDVISSGHCRDIKQFSSSWNQVVVEFILLCQALDLGGVHAKFKFVPYPLYIRAVSEVREGNIMMGAFPMWLHDAGGDVIASDVMVANQSFEKGVYTRKNHKALLGATSLEDLRQFKAITSEKWVVDWATLECLNLPKYGVINYLQMFKMVNAGRGDYVLSTFSASEDMSQKEQGITLVPVPGLKVGLEGSTHFLINQYYPDAMIVYQALQKGLKKLRQQGTIERAYRESGFYLEQTQSWELLSCE